MLVAGCVIFLSLLSSDLSEHAILRQAEESFRAASASRNQPAQARKLFHEAARAYATLHERGVRSAALYRNLGCASLLAGDLPGAVLAFRRGLRLAPHDAELRFFLEHARGEVVYPAGTSLGRPAPDFWPPWLPRPATSLGLILAGLAYAMGCGVVTRWLMVRRAGLLLIGGTLFTTSILLVVALLIQARTLQQELEFPPVVIREDGVLLRKGNGLAYPPRFETPLNRGVEARLLHIRGSWLQIELAGGEIGWIPREYALVDEP